MTIPTISTLPTAPSRTDAPATFISRADAFLAALVTMQSELNTSIGAMNTDIGGIAANVTAAQAAQTAAETAESNAATSETNAATSESNAATSETNAATSEANAAATYDAFDDRYLGAKASDPTLDNDGNPLQTGAQYFNTTNDATRVYNGTSWQDSAPVATSVTVSQISDLTATAAEINVLDGITATTTEINVLDGITATTTELNYIDGVTSAIQSQIDSKAGLSSPTFSGTVTATSFSGDGSSLTGISSPITVSGSILFGGTNVTSAGSESVVLGSDIDATTSNIRNVILGYGAAGGTIGAGFDSNVCIGHNAGSNGTSGTNVFIGIDCGDGGVSGAENVFIGRRAGEDNTSGQKNIYIGSVAGIGGTTDSYSVAIGVDSRTGGNYNVSIGTQSGDSSGGDDNVFIGAFSGTANEESGENIGIGYSVNTPSGGYTKHFKIGHGLQGRAASSSISIGDNISYIYADWGSSASWNRVSDERIKKDFSLCNLGLSFIEDLEPVSYRFKPMSEIEGIQLNEGAEDRKDLDTYYIGFKAQSVRDAVRKYSDHDYSIVNQADDSGLLSMSYEQLITPLVKSVQDLSAKVKELEAEIASLRG